MTGKHYEPNTLNDILVALFNTFFSLGLTVGPLGGSYLTIATDFRFTCDVQSLTLLGFMVLYFCCIYLPMRIKKEPFKPVKKCFSLTSSQQFVQHELDEAGLPILTEGAVKKNQYTLIEDDENEKETKGGMRSNSLDQA